MWNFERQARQDNLEADGQCAKAERSRAVAPEAGSGFFTAVMGSFPRALGQKSFLRAFSL